MCAPYCAVLDAAARGTAQAGATCVPGTSCIALPRATSVCYPKTCNQFLKTAEVWAATLCRGLRSSDCRLLLAAAFLEVLQASVQASTATRPHFRAAKVRPWCCPARAAKQQRRPCFDGQSRSLVAEDRRCLLVSPIPQCLHRLAANACTPPSFASSHADLSHAIKIHPATTPNHTNINYSLVELPADVGFGGLA